jgi:septum formation inhibitor MinC
MSELGEIEKPAAILRGGAKGLEIVVDGAAPVDTIAAVISGRLAEAPGFFRGSDVRIRVDAGPLAPGCLARLDDIANQFDLRIVEVGAKPEPRKLVVEEAVPVPSLAAGSAPLAPAPPPLPVAEAILAPADDPAMAMAMSIDQMAEDLLPEITVQVMQVEEKTKVVVGPVRSGVILEHRGHLVVFGDVNPGAEIRAEGNIVVLGRLRGTAHAGINRDTGFILALRLEPQQLRICRSVARASDSDKPGVLPEIAYVTNSTIVVERYQGRLPNGLAASI